jgi:hypothetical protein
MSGARLLPTVLSWLQVYEGIAVGLLKEQLVGDRLGQMEYRKV